MDFSEYTNAVYSRIQKLEPDNATKIIGYLLLQDYGEQEMARLAMAPEHLIHQVILKAKTELQQLAAKSVASPISPSLNPVTGAFAPYSPVSSRPFSSPAAIRVPTAFWDAQLVAKHSPDFMPLGYSDSIAELQNQAQFLSLEDQIEPLNSGISGFSNDYYRDAEIDNLSGFCKHGSSCRYYHGQVIPESFSQMYGNDCINDDHVISPGSLEKLEWEITELLRSRRGIPISIASLPMMYYDKFGKSLQAEGYLTESQRHGKAGYSLTKLLARLGSSIRLIDRPHGQHAVILAEDSPKYADHRNEKGDPGPIVSGSRQIYLTFPAESTFSEDDVSNYFSTFGPVEDVRIPCQQKRMFGFVTFVHADTVKMILAKGNPHYVCGSRVLVKPYREKSKLVDRKHQERMDPAAYFSPHHADMESDFYSMSVGCDNSRLLRKKLVEEQEYAIELERMRLAELHFARCNHPHSSYFMDGHKFSEDNFNFPSAECFNYLFDVLNSGSTSDDKHKHIDTNYTDHESQGLNLPDSPFATSVASGISAVI
ncbi:zinc finger CCCH domain-containing protein 18-like isoform X1 [Prunus yedoensis var. nudiflora]|uniref:Zinc finger CCCH domain-containing protein 18-like isoform X1 n=1 Tax=Prunus yedoensis var. nudiflora TaxID=2094558 RepID=A0A314V1B6_PRUYE|nr:zinc finger CCCH domain-containing protein 18-like isoform X1 [Prunus yedoensis var. nudiflora]